MIGKIAATVPQKHSAAWKAADCTRPNFILTSIKTEIAHGQNTNCPWSKLKCPMGQLNSLSPDPSPVREGSLKPLKLLNPLNH